MASTQPFAFAPVLERRDDVWRFLHGTPNIPALYAARAGLEIINEVGIAAIRAKSLRQTARLLAPENEYGAWAWELHHSAKKDAPSGTLLQLVEDMKHAGYSRQIDFSSNRAGANPGTHEIGFDSAADTITLRHTARSREGFARGALKAAQWVIGKSGLHEFAEVLFSGEARTMRRPAD